MPKFQTLCKEAGEDSVPHQKPKVSFAFVTETLSKTGWTIKSRDTIRAALEQNPPFPTEQWKWIGWSKAVPQEAEKAVVNEIVALCLERAIQSPFCINSWVGGLRVICLAPASWSPHETAFQSSPAALPAGLLRRLFAAGMRPPKLSSVIGCVACDEDYIAARSAVREFKPHGCLAELALINVSSTLIKADFDSEAYAALSSALVEDVMALVDKGVIDINHPVVVRKLFTPSSHKTWRNAGKEKAVFRLIKNLSADGLDHALKSNFTPEQAALLLALNSCPNLLLDYVSGAGYDMHNILMIARDRESTE